MHIAGHYDEAIDLKIDTHGSAVVAHPGEGGSSGSLGVGLGGVKALSCRRWLQIAAAR